METERGESLPALSEGRRRAEKLLETMAAQQADLAVHGRAVDPDTLAAGQAALADAVAATTKVFEALEEITGTDSASSN